MRRLEFIYEYVCDKNQTTTGERKEMDLFSSLRLFLEDFVCKFLNSESISKTQEARGKRERGKRPRPRPAHSLGNAPCNPPHPSEQFCYAHRQRRRRHHRSCAQTQHGTRLLSFTITNPTQPAEVDSNKKKTKERNSNHLNEI